MQKGSILIRSTKFVGEVQMDKKCNKISGNNTVVKNNMNHNDEKETGCTSVPCGLC